MKKKNHYLGLGWLFFLLGEGLYFLNIWSWAGDNNANIVLVISFCSLISALFIFAKHAYENSLSDSGTLLK